MDPALKDAIVFHSNLNPKIWGDETMLPEVRDDLLLIMDDFREFLGVDGLDIVDITVSGSNAAYTYTPHSDIDLHLVVNVPPQQDKIFAELFDAKKALYNLTRNIKVRGFDVELYVQDSKNPVESMGIYSVMRDKWISFPRRVKAQINDVSVLARVRIYTHRINEALASDDLELAKRVWRDFRAMRKAGLDKGGEFSPENLAYKILRTREMANKLYDHILALKDKQLSLEHIEEQRVDELFNAPIRKIVLADNNEEFKTQAAIGGRVIVFSAKYVPYMRSGDGWDSGWSITFHERASYGNDVGLTGNGKEFDVLSFVKSNMTDLITKHDPNNLTFDAAATKNGSRVGTYERMIQRFLSTTYDVVKYEDNGSATFMLRKKSLGESVVNELFNAPVPKKVISDTPKEVSIEAEIGGRRVVFIAKYMHYLGTSSGWSILFYEPTERSANYGMSGNGKEFEVMGFIKQCLTDLIAKHDPDNLTFSSAKTKNDSRSGAYERIAVRYLSSKYALSKYSDDYETTFLLTRKD